jgi:hypothetical protein
VEPLCFFTAPGKSHPAAKDCCIGRTIPRLEPSINEGQDYDQLANQRSRALRAAGRLSLAVIL